jgi:hypothetical protein
MRLILLLTILFIVLDGCTPFLNRGAPTPKYFTVHQEDDYNILSIDNIEVTIQPCVYRNFPDSSDAVDVLTLMFSIYNNSSDTLSILAQDITVVLKSNKSSSFPTETIIVKKVIGKVHPFSNKSIQEKLIFKMFQKPWLLDNSVLMVKGGTFRINDLSYPISEFVFECKTH